MKSILARCLLVLSGIIMNNPSVLAGDTIHVQTFVNGSNQDSTFVFPSDTIRFEKILMYYKLKCNPLNTPYACGEWDYLTYTYLYDNTGIMDSTLLIAPSYTVDGASPDSVQFMNSASWSYSPSFQTSIIYTSVLSFDSTLVGNGTTDLSQPAGASSPVSRAQYLWKATELSAAGLTSGDISGLRFFVSSAGSTLHNLTIRMKNSAYDSLNIRYYESTALSTVYLLNTTFSSGRNSRTAWTSCTSSSTDCSALLISAPT